MSRDKQIEEMARDIALAEKSLMLDMITASIDDLIDWSIPQNEYIAESLYNAGYRKASDVVRVIIQDIVDPVWRAYQDSENEMTSLLAAFICESIATKIKKKYESEGVDDET